MAKGKKTKDKSAKDKDQAIVSPEAQVEVGSVDDPTEEISVDDLTTEEPTVKAEEQKEPVFCLEDAVRALICDPKEHWMGSIKVRAGLSGLNIHQFYPMARWKDVFIAWGGHGILK